MAQTYKPPLIIVQIWEPDRLRILPCLGALRLVQYSLYSCRFSLAGRLFRVHWAFLLCIELWLMLIAPICTRTRGSWGASCESCDSCASLWNSYSNSDVQTSIVCSLEFLADSNFQYLWACKWMTQVASGPYKPNVEEMLQMSSVFAGFPTFDLFSIHLYECCKKQSNCTSVKIHFRNGDVRDVSLCKAAQSDRLALFAAWPVSFLFALIFTVIVFELAVVFGGLVLLFATEMFTGNRDYLWTEYRSFQLESSSPFVRLVLDVRMLRGIWQWIGTLVQH